MCQEDVFNYRTNLMIAGDFNKTKSTVIYNTIAIHTPAIAVNLYSNALLQKLTGNNGTYISTVNEPIAISSLVRYLSYLSIDKLNWKNIYFFRMYAMTVL